MGELTDAFDKTVEESDAIKPVDAALIATGRAIATRLDEAIASGEEVTKTLYLVPHLNNILKEMLATPLSRKDITPKGGEHGGSKLGRLRAVNNPSA